MFEAILREIQSYDTIILHRHSRPDGDALGSQFGLKNCGQWYATMPQDQLDRLLAAAYEPCAIDAADPAAEEMIPV
mgnify:CR=1 FL=1